MRGSIQAVMTALRAAVDAVGQAHSGQLLDGDALGLLLGAVEHPALNKPGWEAPAPTAVGLRSEASVLACYQDVVVVPDDGLAPNHFW
jgi:hypothetical protein